MTTTTKIPTDVTELRSKLISLQKDITDYSKFLTSFDIPNVNTVKGLSNGSPSIKSRNTIAIRNTFQVDIFGQDFTANSKIVFSAYELYWKTGATRQVEIAPILSDSNGNFIHKKAIVYPIVPFSDWKYRWIFIDAIDVATGKRASIDIHLPPYFDNGGGA